MLVFCKLVLKTSMAVLIKRSHLAISPASETSRRDVQVDSQGVGCGVDSASFSRVPLFLVTYSGCCVHLVAVLG